MNFDGKTAAEAESYAGLPMPDLVELHVVFQSLVTAVELTTESGMKGRIGTTAVFHFRFHP